MFTSILSKREGVYNLDYAKYHFCNYKRWISFYYCRVFDQISFFSTALLITLLITGVTGLSASAQVSNETKPNIIFIIVDDQTRSQFGFISPDTALTPNIDRLAREGTYFPNGFTTSTVCTPSRYTCLTGRYPSQSSDHAFTRDITEEGMTVVSFNTHVEMDRPNIPRVLQEAGYVTGIVGKWHVGVPDDYREEVPPPDSDPNDPEISALLVRNQVALSEAIQAYGFDYAANLYAGNALDSSALKNTGMTAHNMEWLTQGALEFIDANYQEPFYLYFSTTLPHWPPPLDSMKGDPRITAAGLLKKPIMVQPSREEVIQRVIDAGYDEEAAGTAWIDDGIGAIIAKLKEYDISDNTLIIFFNDHGMENGSKSSLYDGAVRTPIIASWPKHIKPQVSDAVVSSIDFAPTIFAAAGVSAPKKMDLRGVSFLPVAEGLEGKTSREYAYSELGYTRAVTGHDWKYLAFRLPESARLSKEESMRVQTEYLAKVKQDHSWVTWEPESDARIPHTGGPPGGDFLTRLVFLKNGPFLKNYYDPDQLYDLSQDSLETNNLAENPDYSQQLAVMQSVMTEFLEDLPGTYAELKSQN